jgi:cytochrome c oxidase subunit 1
MLAAVPLNIQVHDTFFVVAHFHYVLIGGAVFPLVAAWYYWFPKITGRLMSERVATVAFALFFIGFNLTFFPMHQLGLHGMPRRVYTYPPGMGWETLNLVATAGALLMTGAVALFMVDAVRALRVGVRATDNPWGAGTLEWATSSPPPSGNFVPLPTVSGREPLWENPPNQPIVVGVRTDIREVLVTYVLDAEPDHLFEFPEPSPWPFWAAVATTVLFIWSIFTPWGVVYGAVPVFITLVGWFWPKRGPAGTERAPIPAMTHAGEARATGGAA